MSNRKEFGMRFQTWLVAAVAMLLAFSVAVCFGAGDDASAHRFADTVSHEPSRLVSDAERAMELVGAHAAPSVFFPETHFEFTPVLEGSLVVHDFVIQNKGNATLNVDRVKTG